MGAIEIISLILGGGGIGSFITWAIHLKANKKIKDAEAEEKVNLVRHDNFEILYTRINTLIGEYNKLDDEYRLYRETSTVKSKNFLSKIEQNCEILAELKSLVQYLKGLRCYDTGCPNRIKFNPDKLK